MNIKTLTMIVEEKLKCNIIWDFDKKYTAFNDETGEVVAEYNVKNDKLIFFNFDKNKKEE